MWPASIKEMGIHSNIWTLGYSTLLRTSLCREGQAFRIERKISDTTAVQIKLAISKDVLAMDRCWVNDQYTPRQLSGKPSKDHGRNLQDRKSFEYRKTDWKEKDAGDWVSITQLGVCRSAHKLHCIEVMDCWSRFQALPASQRSLPRVLD